MPSTTLTASTGTVPPSAARTSSDRAGRVVARGRPSRGRRRDSASASAASVRKRSIRRRLKSRLSEPTTSARSTFAASTCGSARPSPAARAIPPRRGSSACDDAGLRRPPRPSRRPRAGRRRSRRAWVSRPDGAPASGAVRGREVEPPAVHGGDAGGDQVRPRRAPRTRRRGAGSSRGRRGRPDTSEGNGGLHRAKGMRDARASSGARTGTGGRRR